MAHLFHITGESDWVRWQEQGQYFTPSLDEEGFIHLSTAAQVEGTLNRFFTGQTGLVLLEIDPRQLSAPLKLEEVAGHGTFPHLYGPLNVDAVVRVRPVMADAQGKFSWSAEPSQP